jgi:p25-alpha
VCCHATCYAPRLRSAAGCGAASQCTLHRLAPRALSSHHIRSACAAPLRRVFISYALFGKGRAGGEVQPRDVRMDGAAFAKAIKEAGLGGKGIEATRVDLCFAKCCEKARHCGCALQLPLLPPTMYGAGCMQSRIIALACPLATVIQHARAGRRQFVHRACAACRSPSA